MDKGRILLSLTGFHPQRWQELLSAERPVVLEPETPDDPTIRYAVVWKQPPKLLASLPNLAAIFSIGAGVDHLLQDKTVPDVPIVRVVADNLSRHMTEFVVWRVLDHHRQGQLYRSQQARRTWHEAPQRVAGDISVGIMGLGQLGRAAAKALLALGFRINGWTRRATAVEGVSTFAGEQGLIPFLNATDMLVVLLPLTPDTQGIVSYELLRQLRRRNGLGGAVLINAGRGQTAARRGHPEGAGRRDAQGGQPRRVRNGAAAANEQAMDASEGLRDAARRGDLGPEPSGAADGEADARLRAGRAAD